MSGFLMKCCTFIWSSKSKNGFIRGSKSDDPTPLLCLSVYPHDAV